MRRTHSSGRSLLLLRQYGTRSAFLGGSLPKSTTARLRNAMTFGTHARHAGPIHHIRMYDDARSVCPSLRMVPLDCPLHFVGFTGLSEATAAGVAAACLDLMTSIRVFRGFWGCHVLGEAARST